MKQKRIRKGKKGSRSQKTKYSAPGGRVGGGDSNIYPLGLTSNLPVCFLGGWCGAQEGGKRQKKRKLGKILKWGYKTEPVNGFDALQSKSDGF
jgi:hypothetical protein